VRVGSQIRVSGLVGVDVTSGRLAGPSIQEQTRQALTSCRAVLSAGGASLDDVVEVGVLLADPDDFAGMNEDMPRGSPSIRRAVTWPSSARSSRASWCRSA